MFRDDIQNFARIAESLPMIYITHFTQLEKLRVLQLNDDTQFEAYFYTG